MLDIVRVRYAQEEDFPTVLLLINKLAAHIGEEGSVRNTIEQMKEDNNLFNCLILESEKSGIVGIATYFYAYFSWVGKSLYMDDFIIREDMRGIGLGKYLFDSILQEAEANACKQVRWEVTKNNSKAQNFYLKNNAEMHDDILVCQKQIQ